MKFSLPILCILLSLNSVLGQLKIPELSPAGQVIQNVGFTQIKVYYERPAVRGRTPEDIWGKLVPWDKVWRTGAGNCTTISLSQEVTINNKKIPGGKYALFTIPRKDKWTIILNKDTLAYGAYRYDQALDVVRVDVKPVNTERFFESLTIDIDVIPNDARVFISWLNTQVSFDIRTGLDLQIKDYILKNVSTHKSNNPDDYEAAISYYLWHQGERNELMVFINKGIALKDDRIWYYWKVEEFMRQQKWKEAEEAARYGIKVIEKSEESTERKKELIADFTNYLNEIKKRQ